MRKTRRFLCMLLATIMMFSLAAISGAVSADGAAALPIAVPDNAIVIIHTNDVHGALDAYPKVAALKKAYQDAGAYVLLADAGDFIQGGAHVNMYKGETAVELMNMAGYDVACLGNHEFDFGSAVLPPLLAKAKFPIVSANTLKDNKPLFGDRTTFTTPDGTKIGVFGINTPQTKTKSKPTNTTGIDIPAEDVMFKIAQEQVDALKAENCDYIVCLAHLGVGGDAEGNRSTDMLAKVNGIDLLIDGHSHNTLKEMRASIGGAEKLNGTVITSTGTKFANVGIVVIAGGEVKAYNVAPGDVKVSDAAIAARVAEINADVELVYGVKIGTSEVDVPIANKGSKEIAMGDLITDAMYWKSKKMGINVDAAVMNGGGIRMPIAKGDVTKMTINNVLSLGWSMTTLKLTGAQLLEALEAGAFSTPNEAGGFGHVRGIEYTINIGLEYDKASLYPGGSTFYKPASIRRVSIQTVAGKPFDMNATYTIASNSHISAGGATYYAFTQASLNADTGEMLDELLMEYIVEELGGKITAADYGQPQGRITIVNIPEQAFKDVAKGDWFYEGVTYVSEKGLMTGMGGDAFAPQTALTRAMMAQILHNMDGKPAVTGSAGFTDVAAGAWYASAVTWAAKNGIVTGVTATAFGPETSLSREQLATMLYRYAQYKKMDTSAAADLSAYKDAGSVSSWALPAMKWVNAKGVVTGKTVDTLQPGISATRAEIATVMARFAKLNTK